MDGWSLVDAPKSRPTYLSLFAVFGEHSSFMFTLPGLLAILVAHYTKVHEITPSLQRVPCLNLAYLAACCGFLLDIRLGLLRAEACPQLRIAIPLWLWTLVSIGFSVGITPDGVTVMMVYVMLFLIVAQGVQSFRVLRVVALSILAISLFLGLVAAIQATRPFMCIPLMPDVPDFRPSSPDGRFCETTAECHIDAEPGQTYMCERPGPLMTASVGHGRVRYRGILEDPNELALSLVITLPFAMIMFAQRRSVLNLLLLIVAFAIVFPVVVLTGSRTGQLAFVAVVAVYVMQRVSWKGILAAAVLAAPALLLGGRSGEEAEGSTTDRLEAWSAGIDMVRSSPLWGIGKGQFSEQYVITAHNSFVLAAAELGLIGMALWVGVLYTGLKITLLAIRRYRGRPDASVPHAWARALFASLIGITVGTSFLSLGYHPVVWTFLALPGAYYLAARRHDPEFRVVFGIRDLLVVATFAILYLAGTKVYLLARGIY
jgi:hypothetical protein